MLVSSSGLLGKLNDNYTNLLLLLDAWCTVYVWLFITVFHSATTIILLQFVIHFTCNINIDIDLTGENITSTTLTVLGLWWGKHRGSYICLDAVLILCYM